MLGGGEFPLRIPGLKVTAAGCHEGTTHSLGDVIHSLVLERDAVIQDSLPVSGATR